MVFFPVKDNTENGVELLHSVRSVAKFLPDEEIVIVSAKKPIWANSNVRFLHCRDVGRLGGLNVWRKITLFCRQYERDFINMNDDIFLMQPYDYKSVALADGLLTDRAESLSKGNYYRQRVLNTMAFLQGIGKPIVNFEIHQPFYMEWKAILWMEQHLKIDYMNYLYKSIYGNITGIRYREARHCKLSTPDHIEEGMTYISTNEAFMKEGGAGKLAELFPDKCHFEK